MVYRRFLPESYPTADVLQVLGGAPKAAIGDTIDMLVWNIYKARIRRWETDFRALMQNRDLILLQESVLNTQYDPIFLNPESFEWIMARSHRNLKTLASTGVKTGANVKSATQNFFLAPDVEPILKTPKMMLATTYPLAKSQNHLLVLNVHAINFVSFQKFSRQMVQITQAIADHNGPVILAGDFNTWNAPRYKSLQDIAAKLNLTEAALTRKGRLQHLNKHLDHVFYRGLTLEKADVLADILTSDHFPISVRFSVPSESL